MKRIEFVLCLFFISTVSFAQKEIAPTIIRKTKCSCDLERNVLQRKTKRYRNTIFPKIFSTGLRRFYKLR